SRAGRHEDSLAALAAVARLDPFGTPLADALRARAHVLAGRPREGLAAARGCAARAPELQPCLVFLVVAAQASGETEEAKAVAARLLEVNGGFSVARHLALVPYRRDEDSLALGGWLSAAGLPD